MVDIGLSLHIRAVFILSLFTDVNDIFETKKARIHGLKKTRV